VGTCVIISNMSPLPQKDIERIIDANYNGDARALLRDLEQFIATKENPATGIHAKVDFGPTLIELKGVTRTYRPSRKNIVEAVRGVDLHVQEREIVALTGPSGSGKSTLMHLIAGLDQPTAGEVLVDGKQVHKLSESKLAHYRNETVGVVFQFFYLQPFLRVNRNVEVPLMFARRKRAERKEPVEHVISAVGLSDRITFLPKELSGGQMQRVAIARALVNRPKILLADEPTGNLDSKNSDAIMELLQTIRTTLGTTMIIVTHDPKVASWADRIVRLEDGKVI
jgi:putative ABC transport system ATP-binding protein